MIICLCKYCRVASKGVGNVGRKQKTKHWYENGNLKVNMETGREKTQPRLRLFKRAYRSWAWKDIKYWAE